MLIFLGAHALERWHWVTYIFGMIVLYAAYRAFRKEPRKSEGSPLVEWLAKNVPVTEKTQGGRFIARENGRAATPLLLAVITIELTDIMMAMDSVAVLLDEPPNVCHLQR